MNRRIVPVALLILTIILSGALSPVKSAMPNIEQVATEYVRLLLYAGQFDEDLVDAYYGPDSLKPKTMERLETEKPPYDSLASEAGQLLAQLKLIPVGADSANTPSRTRHLEAQLTALQTRMRLLAGEKLPFDEESKLIYDVIVPEFPDNHFDSIVTRLDSLIPGEGELFSRWKAFADRYLVSPGKIEPVLKAAIDEVRRRTREHYRLPEGERFDLELVHDVSWGAYNWYQGNYHSLIQYNADSPMRLTHAVGLAAHEGYPGHHVAGIVQDSLLYRRNGWIEFSIAPLFSPTSIFSEGLANYGVELVFPRDERIKFEAETLCPLAGIDSTGLGLYWELRDLFNGLDWVWLIASRNFLDGRWTREETAAWLSKYSEPNPDQIERGLKFTEQYRAYRVTYTMGEELVRECMKREASGDREKQWQLFWNLCAEPVVPSDLNR